MMCQSQNKIPTGRLRVVTFLLNCGTDLPLQREVPVMEQEMRIESHTPCGASIRFVWEPIPDKTGEIFLLEGTHYKDRYGKEPCDE